MIKIDVTQQNHLLDALPADNYHYLSMFLELVELQCGDVLHESGETLRYAYFPTTCLVSMFYITEDGTSTELALIGNEGLIGIALYMGGETMLNRAVVVTSGYAYRLRANLFKQEFNRIGGKRSGALRHLLLRYTQAQITHMTQIAACNRYHSIDQQLCRWLLQSLDRLNSDEITVTQGAIANMLGVRREGITEAAGKLQRAGLIRYNRGHIEVLNRSGLETRACECYRVVKTEFDRLLPALPDVYSLPPPIRTNHHYVYRT